MQIIPVPLLVCWQRPGWIALRDALQLQCGLTLRRRQLRQPLLLLLLLHLIGGGLASLPVVALPPPVRGPPCLWCQPAVQTPGHCHEEVVHEEVVVVAAVQTPGHCHREVVVVAVAH